MRHRFLLPALIAVAGAVAGCGGGAHPAAVATRTSAPTATSTSATETGTASRTAPATETTPATTPTVISTSATSAAPAPTTTPTATTTAAATTTTTAASAQSTTQTVAAQTRQACGSVDFSPSSSYLATSITAVGSDCPTARAVASASRSHQFDPPSGNAPVQGFTADGFTCVGSRDSGSMLALSDYRCTRGTSVVTFQRS
jgi:hypothetical protein